MILDHSDAFNEIPLDERELNFCCADLGEEGFMVFYGMGFGGRSFPNIYGRQGSLLCRLTQAMFSPAVARLQQFVDDPILTAQGGAEAAPGGDESGRLGWGQVPRHMGRVHR